MSKFENYLKRFDIAANVTDEELEKTQALHFHLECVLKIQKSVGLISHREHSIFIRLEISIIFSTFVSEQFFPQKTSAGCSPTHLAGTFFPNIPQGAASQKMRNSFS